MSDENFADKDHLEGKVLTSEDVIDKKFSSAKFQKGYNFDDVDDLLDRIAEGLSTLNKEKKLLESYQNEPISSTLVINEIGSIISPEDIVNSRFKETKKELGYNQDQVDIFLNQVASTLRKLALENLQLRQSINNRNQVEG